MGRPSAPAATKARALALSRTLDARGVEEALRREGIAVGKSSVARWVAEAKAARPASKGAASKKKAQAPTSTPPKTGAGAKATKAPGKTAPSSDDDIEAIDLEGADYADLAKLAKETWVFLRAAHAADEERRYATLAKLLMDVRTRMAKLRPAPKFDPMLDPANLEASAAVLEKFGQMVRARGGFAEAKAP